METNIENAIVGEAMENLALFYLDNTTLPTDYRVKKLFTIYQYIDEHSNIPIPVPVKLRIIALVQNTEDYNRYVIDKYKNGRIL
jgi:hypothetical protein